MSDFFGFSNEELENLTPDQIDEIAEAYVSALPDDPEAQAEALGVLKKVILLSVAQGGFSLEGFKAFFEYMNGFPLHREGEKWAANIFKALRSTRKLLQEAFRGSGKTTVISKFFLAYYLGHHPWTTNMIVRVNTQKARETALEVATLIEKDTRWREVFPEVVPDKDRGWGAETGYYLKKYMAGVDGEEDYSSWLKVCSDTARPSGPTFIGYGYDSGSNQGSRTNGILLIDDIHDKENTKSDRQLADVKFYVKDVLLPIPVPGEGLEVWNYTPWLTNDAYAERAATGRYVHSRSAVMEEITAEEFEETPARIRNGKNPPVIFWARDWQLPEDIENEFEFSYPFAGKFWRLAWPGRWTQEEIARKFQDILNVSFARMYQLDLKATEGLKLRREWLHRYPHDKIDPSWPRIAGIDYASVSDKLKHKDRDYFAMAVGALIPGGGLVLETGIRAHLTKGEALNKAAQMCWDYPSITMIGVEAIGKGEEFYNDFRLTDDLYGNPLPIFPITSHSQSKGKRFEEYLGPRFQFSRIWVTNNVDDEFIKHFENEWLSYPNNTNDDCLDAAYLMAMMADPNLKLTGIEEDKRGHKKPEKKIHPVASSFGRR